MEDKTKLLKEMLQDIDTIKNEIESVLNKEESTDLIYTLPDTVDTYEIESFYRETIKEEPEKKSGSWFKKAVAFFLICTIGTSTLGFGLGAGFGYLNSRNGRNESNIATGQNIENIMLTSTSYSFENVNEVGTVADMIELIMPTVVTITTRRSEDIVPQMSIGSGIIFAEDEDRIFIATNLYVVTRGQQYDIRINGSDMLRGNPVGLDIGLNLAVLSVYKYQLAEAGVTEIVIASFGDSDQARFGDMVIAIGNAMGEGTSATSGIISAPTRETFLPNNPTPQYFIQTDAAINYGSSGGPLINTRGEVIGININLASLTIFGQLPVEGMAYSIPSNIAYPALMSIITSPRSPAIGIRGGTISEETASSLGIPALGVYVSEVTPGHGAFYAGMREGDVITGINGSPVFDMESLRTEIRELQVGETAEVRVIRDGEAILLRITLGYLIVEF